MTKKWLCFLMCFFLTSCATISPNEAVISSDAAASNEKSPAYSINENALFFDTSIGTSTDNGFYFLELQSDGTYNSKYIDYNTCTEMVLCENLNCLHKDETCSGHGESSDNTPRFVPFKENLLAIFTGSLSPNAADKNAFPRVEIMTATGSDPKLLVMLDDYLTIDSTFAIDNQNLYLLATKTDRSKQSEFKEFIKIDISTKTSSVIYTFSEENMITFEAVVNNKFVFKKTVTPFDKEKAPQSSEEWEEMFAKKKHELFFINNYGECEAIKTWLQNELKKIIVDDEMIYFAENKIYSLNLATGIEGTLANDIEQKLVGYEELTPVALLDKHLLLHAVIVNDDGTVKYTNLIVNLENDDVYESTLHIKDSANLNNPIHPMAQLENDILIVNEVKTIQEIVEAKDGTKSKQENMVNSYALTGISDFINNVENAKNIKRIS